MDTKDVAAKLGTTPRQLRQFLRSPMSSYVAVGSGARYDFRDQDMPTLQKRFNEWKGAGKPKPAVSAQPGGAKDTPVDRTETQKLKDQSVWEEEGPVMLEDIRDPRIRARVQRDARAAEDRLTVLLIAQGLHVVQRSA